MGADLNDSQVIFDLFDRLGIGHKTVPHVSVDTADALAGVDASQWEFPVKNIFVYDKKKNFFLVTVRLDCPPIDLKALGQAIGARGRLSFVRAELLADMLKVRPGSVSPYAIFHDSDCDVKVVLDARLRDCSSISAHPLSNDQTTTISLDDLKRLYEHTGHDPLWVDVPFKSFD